MEKEGKISQQGAMMKKKLLALLMGTSLVLAACGGNEDSADTGSSSSTGNETTTVDAGDAAKLYENKCSACHGQNLEGSGGPELTAIGSELSKEEIEKIIIEGKGRMPGGVLDESEAAQVAEWLASKK
jgi:cytochrome c551